MFESAWVVSVDATAIARTKSLEGLRDSRYSS
jgi:hypothetical protein